MTNTLMVMAVSMLLVFAEKLDLPVWYRRAMLIMLVIEIVAETISIFAR